MDSRLSLFSLGILVLCACLSAPESDMHSIAAEAPEASPMEADDSLRARKPAKKSDRKNAVLLRRGPPSSPSADTDGLAMAIEMEEQDLEAPDDVSDRGGAAQEEVRDWFPDAFLWEPMIQTDASGTATVDVTVPDTLTDWRILGLAHDATGQQGGALAHFASRLPVYGDPTVPSVVFVGDRLEFPVRAVNGTSRPLTATVSVRAEGAMSGAGTSALSLGPDGVGVRTVPLQASDIGSATIRTTVSGGGHTDTSERRIHVRAAGKPVQTSQRGALSKELALTLPAPAGDDLSSETLEVVVFPGPLALVQAEVDRMAAGARPALPGASLQAANHLSVLAKRTGATVDDAALRRLRLLGWQRVARDISRANDQRAVDILLAVSENDALGGIEAARPALLAKITQGQRPDGTWSWSKKSTLQQVLVQTALAAWVLPETHVAAKLKAQGVGERNVPSIKDPYTAAVMVGSGLLESEAADLARGIILEGLVRDEAGVPTVQVPDGVLNPWGQRPNRTAMLAWTVLALLDHAESETDRGMLAAELMGRWSASRGFAAGKADPIALAAVVQAVPGASGATTVSLMVDGKAISSGKIDPTQPGVPVVLSAPGGEATLAVEPAVSGLAFTATRTAYAPWPKRGGIDGIEWEFTLPETLKVGTTTAATMTFAAPRGTSITLEQGIPAGLEVDAEDLAGQDAVLWSEVLEDRVRMGLKPMPNLGSATVTLALTPQFAGRFSTVPTRLTAADKEAVLRPAMWSVAR